MSISIYQLDSGKWRGDVIVKGLRRSKVDRLKSDVQRWTRDAEAELRREASTKKAMSGPAPVTFDYAMQLYSIEQSTLKQTHLDEVKKVNLLRKSLPHLDWPIDKITDEHLSGWQDQLKRSNLSDGTILRYFSLLSAIFEWARTIKKWVKINPTKDVKKPKKPPHRVRRISGDEIESMLAACNYRFGDIPSTSEQQSILAWLIAISSGMRSSEILNRNRKEINLLQRSVFLKKTKNGTSRIVPLEIVAANLWSIALMMNPESQKVFSLTASQRDASWREVRAKAGLANSDLTFHDSRHEAASQLAKKFSLLELAKVFGWLDPKHAMIYFNPTHDELLSRLDNGNFGHNSFDVMQDIVVNG